RWLPARGGAGGAGGRGGGAVADMGHPGGWVLRKSYTLAETSEFPAYAPGRAPPCPLESDTHWGPRKTFTKRLAAGRVKSLRGRPARRRTPSSGPPRSPGTPARRWMTVEAGHSGACRWYGCAGQTAEPGAAGNSTPPRRRSSHRPCSSG